MEKYSVGEKVRVPAKLEDGAGIARVYADFRLLIRPSLGPASLVPDPTKKVVLRGEAGGEKEATVVLEGEIRDEHAPGEYLCVSLHVYDTRGNVDLIAAPSPSKVFRVVKGADENHGEPARFLGWDD